jgi:hypothetical protein
MLPDDLRFFGGREAAKVPRSSPTRVPTLVGATSPLATDMPRSLLNRVPTPWRPTSMGTRASAITPDRQSERFDPVPGSENI